MSPRDWTLFIADMQEACDKIADYTRGIDFSAFCADTRTVDAVVHVIAANVCGAGVAVAAGV